MIAFKKIFNTIRTNGCQNLQDGKIVRQIVYSNIIWLAAYVTYFIYTTATAIFSDIPLISFLLVAAFFHVLYISCFLLTKYKYSNLSKHLLIITTYLAVLVFDHLSNKETFTLIYLLAFLPSALNIFTLKTNKISVGLYLLYPFVYLLFTQLVNYQYPHLYFFTSGETIFLKALNITLGFLLSVVFAGYMILNNIAKQKKLLVQSISLQATLDNSAASIWSIDNEFNLTATNIKYIESLEDEFGIFGLKAGVNLKTHALWKKLPTAFKDQYYYVLAGNELINEVELNEKYYEVKAVPIYDEKGKIQGATFGSREITESKIAQITLLKAKQDAEDASKAKERFLSNMSHEIRTPLNGITGITRIMQDEPFLPEQLNNLKTLEDLSEHTLQIVSNILDFAKIEAGKASLDNKRFNLLRLANKINSIFAGTAQLKGIKFIIETEGETDVFVKGDEVRLSQVLINLIGNAFKFTEKGSITLKICIKDISSDVYEASFYIIDTGIGIKNENIGKIFESFSQAESNTTRRFGGTGLGLTIADKILSLMQSQLLVKSEFGYGTTFFFHLNLQKSSFTPKKSIINLQEIKAAFCNIKILLAEDNKINQMVAGRILEKWGSKVIIANNGEEALFLSQKDNFDVVLMDLDMPVMDGYEALEKIKTTLPHLPIIALTAASFDDMNNYLSLKGFSGVVQKPFVPEDLYKNIISVLHKEALPETTN